MTALKSSDIEAFVAKPGARQTIVLVYGPDSGLVRERVDAILAKSVDDPRDPFSLARLDDAALADEPQRLVEEAHTIPLFGGRRAVWVKAGSRSIVAALELLIAAPPGKDCMVVIEAGDLARNAPLRALCEKAKEVAAIPCYADDARDVARVIEDEMRQAGLAITSEARALLASLLGGDRLASRGEIRKLALYAHGREQVDVDDVLAVVADASALALDAIVDSAFAGRPADVETHYAKARGAGTRPDVIAQSALRQAMQLHRAKLAVEGGESVESAAAGFRPPLHFRRKPLVEAALRAWSAARLEKTIGQFADVVLDARRRAALADPIVERALLATAQTARRRDQA
ncbi:MAG TPA: DNA polymerase III subunit delta [Xanthobacteraceae bacterium]|nr:DNA polymerase III subunit delta [Xanthobacteraceae bacterium]